MTRKVFGILLFACLLAPAVVTLSYLQYHKVQVRKAVKHRMIAGIDRSELVLLTFTEREAQQELRWEHRREFEYKGEMYDIVERKVVGDTLYFWCWWDYAETTLNKKLKSLTTKLLGQQPLRKKQQEKTLDFYKKWYSHTYYLATPKGFNKVRRHSAYFSRWQSLYFTPPVPPPVFV